MSARGIFGRGRDTRRDSTGTAGSLRMVDSRVLEERVSLELVGISQVRPSRSDEERPWLYKYNVTFVTYCILNPNNKAKLTNFGQWPKWNFDRDIQWSVVQGFRTPAFLGRRSIATISPAKFWQRCGQLSSGQDQADFDMHCPDMLPFLVWDGGLNDVVGMLLQIVGPVITPGHTFQEYGL